MGPGEGRTLPCPPVRRYAPRGGSPGLGSLVSARATIAPSYLQDERRGWDGEKQGKYVMMRRRVSIRQ